jgi:glycosyltransferase involved in cell wall biosynthesis/tetratricopeptide (TPR) repeat protein
MANLERCLTAVADHIVCWVIGDTGSSDGTQDFIISFFAARNLPGELHSFPFHNFEQARNAALDHAYASPLDYDYLLFADADMELVVEDPRFRARLEAPGYRLIQRTGSGLTYGNTRLVKRDAGARYHGVTHEYVDVPGGVEQLHRVWYKDHASGSNRVDKFERDIRLLTKALEQEPENHRYWFYLAQSYKDAGRTREAADTYAKRAEMGGWAEEAWYARLQEARCLRALGDEGGFLRQALMAFNQRPQRAEPLYDLARFYRERGMNEASVLFSEAGLAVPRPDEDVLFLEDFVYTAGLKEEYSIAANYSRDPARKDRGHAACNWLALNRDVPPGSRNLARANLFFYLEPAAAMMPSFAARPIGFTPPDGYRPMNPSVARLGDQLVLVQRSVNFTLTDDNEYRTSIGEPVRTRNFLLRLSNDLEIQSSAEILAPADMPEPAYPELIGFEDMRLFAWKDALWCCATVRELTPEGWCEQVLARLDEREPGQCRLTDWRLLHPEGPRLHEKNWMPQVKPAPAEAGGDRLQFIYLCDPTRVLDDQARKISEAASAIAAEQFSGGSQAIAFDDGWLALIHEIEIRDGRRCYQHRFVWFDEANTLRRVSRRFFFHEKGIEFAAGLAWDPDRKRLMVSYGVGDSEAWIATVEPDEVRRVLDDVEHLPSGAPGNGRTQQPSPAWQNAAAHEVSRAVAHHTNFPQRPAPGPVAQVQKSAWVPQAPAAGTELMVAGLRERMGRELDRINLKVNHPGPDDGDNRPRVVWIHHDANQTWVQWCKDKALVDLVSCFVFVSYWQRERYLATFGLPPERCVVLQNATEVGPDLRPWDPGPVWRCAYTSTPFRGLSILLDAWERLSRANGELHVWSSMKLYLEDDTGYSHLYERAQSMPGVIYHGIVPNPELRVMLRSMHFLVYPCIFAETSCLAVIEAMAAGCRVIVPSLGALPETTCGYARVYPWNSDADSHAAALTEVLADEMTGPWTGAPELSTAQQRHCAAVYDWRRREHAWRQLIGSLCGGTVRHQAEAAAAPLASERGTAVAEEVRPGASAALSEADAAGQKDVSAGQGTDGAAPTKTIGL